MGRIVGLHLAKERETPVTPVEAAEAIAGRGLKGDRHAARASGGKRQILLLDDADRRALGLEPGTLKENVLVEGLALETLLPGQRLALGPQVIVELSMTCVPCQKLNRIRPGLLKESWGRRGQLARVLVGGALEVGDTVRLLDVNPEVPPPIRPKLP